MPRGDKSSYTDKQERKADHIAKGYEKRGVSEAEAERRAWATVNKDDGGGEEVGLGPWQAHGPPGGAQGRPARRQGFGITPRECAVGFGEKGSSNAQAACVALGEIMSVWAAA